MDIEISKPLPDTLFQAFDEALENQKLIDKLSST